MTQLSLRHTVSRSGLVVRSLGTVGEQQIEGAAGVGQDRGRRGALLLSTGAGDLPSGSVQLLQQAAQVGGTDRHTSRSRTIAGGTNEGLAAAKARGVRLGRPPAMTPEQVQSAQTLLSNPDNTVSSTAKLAGVSRSTIYKYVPQLATQPGLPLTDSPSVVVSNHAPTEPQPIPAPAGSATCPTCGHRRDDARELQLNRDDLATLWLPEPFPCPSRPSGGSPHRTGPTP